MRNFGWLLAVLALACTPVRRRAGGMLVRDISFEGNGGFFSGHNDLQLKAQMDQAEARFGLLLWPFIYYVDPKILDRERLIRDAYRLEVWYAHHGWFDARVLGWELREIRRSTERRAGVVDIRGKVDPGPQSTVRSLEVVGATPEVQGIVRAALRKAPIQVGAPFDRDLVEATRIQLLQLLQNAAHPYATVASEMTAHPEELGVDVVLTVDPGIAGKLGEVRISGNEAVQDRFIEQSADLHTGEAYNLDALRDAQRRLFEMGTFSLVTVEPDLSDPTAVRVPLQVQLTESKFGTLRFGVGFDYDSAIPSLRASTRLQHVNLFRQLIRAELGARVGYAFDIVSTSDFTPRRPTYGADFSLEYPRLFLQKASLELRGQIAQDNYSGLWEYRRPEVDLHLIYRPSDELQLRWGPHFESYTFLGTLAEGDSVTLEAAQQRLFGIAGQESFQYQLSAIDHFVTLDWRDDPVSPTRGSFSSLNLRAAYALSEAGYSFVRTSAEHRHYFPLRARDENSAYPLTLALRGRTTVILPYDRTETIPLPERAFLGGSTSIRGFRPNQVGEYSTLCTYRQVTSGGVFWVKGDETTTTELVQYHLPRGGNLSGELSAEVRYDWAYGVTPAVFVDAGVLSKTLSSFLLDPRADLRFSGGFGFRYNTIVGPLRLDFSFRPLYPEDRGPIGYPLCNESDRIPRINDFFSNFAALRSTETHPPFALVVFLTFGEAL